MKKLYQYLEEIYLERYFDYTDFNVENFINFVRSKENIIINNEKDRENYLSDDKLKAVFLDLRDENNKKVEDTVSANVLEILKNELYTYKERPKKIAVPQLEKLAAMYFYTNNFPIIWNNYVNNKKTKIFAFKSDEDKEIENIKQIYQNIFESILSTVKDRQEILVDKILKTEEKEIEKKVEEKINKNSNKDNFLLDLFNSFKKKSIVEKIMTIKRKRMLKKMFTKNKLINEEVKDIIKIMNEILIDVKENKKIDIQSVINLNKYIINMESFFNDKIYHAGIVFIPDIKTNSKEIVEKLMNKIGYKINNKKEFLQIKLN